MFRNGEASESHQFILIVRQIDFLLKVFNSGAEEQLALI